VLDDDSPLAPGRKYVITLASVAQKQGLHKRNLLPPQDAPERKALQDAIDNLNFSVKIRIGFDPTHLSQRASRSRLQKAAPDRPEPTYSPLTPMNRFAALNPSYEPRYVA